MKGGEGEWVVGLLEPALSLPKGGWVVRIFTNHLTTQPSHHLFLPFLPFLPLLPFHADCQHHFSDVLGVLCVLLG